MFKLFSKKVEIEENEFVAVVSGDLVPLTSVNDDVFSKKMLGEGVAISPNDETIVAPCDGEITMLYPTMHAFGIKSKGGIEILVHIGIDTVNKKGIGFRKYVKQGDIVKAGDKIIHINSYDLKNEGYDLTTMMLFPNCGKELKIKTSGIATKGKTIVANY